MQARRSGHGGGGDPKLGGLCLNQKLVLAEPWSIFNETIWMGDGDQEVSGGLFHGNAEANAAAADFIAPVPIPIQQNGGIVFSNRLHLMDASGEPNLETGAIFMVNTDTGATFNCYAFLNFGFAQSSDRVFVELFGSDNGRDFDQIKEFQLADPTNPVVDLDFWIKQDQYQVGVGGVLLDSVSLTHPLTTMSLFEVGVYGSRIDSTAITVVQSKRSHGGWRFQPPRKCHNAKRYMGKNGHIRNAPIRMAREKMRHCSKPSIGMKHLADMKEKPEI